jgi:hypothetical protein
MECVAQRAVIDGVYDDFTNVRQWALAARFIRPEIAKWPGMHGNRSRPNSPEHAN